MRFFVGNTGYLFTIAQGDNGSGSTSTDSFRIEFEYSKSQESVPQSSHTKEKTYLHLLNDHQHLGQAEVFMFDVLKGFQVPENIGAHMSEHFKFHLFRSRSCQRRGGSFSVVVRLEVTEYTAERAAVIQRRMESMRRLRETEREQGHRVGVVERELVLPQPADKRVVERLEREVVVVVNGDDDKCAICLGKIVVGEEVIKLPCLHVYHSNCIIKWLDRTHYCPYCRSELL